MSEKPPLLSLYQAAIFPDQGFAEAARMDPAWDWVLLRFTLLLLVMPPLFSFIGGSSFGWRLGADQPLFLGDSALLIISVAYFAVLLFGFITTALISHWMASTYGASRSLGKHFMLVSIVGAPLAAGSAAHLFPDVFFNLLVMIPAIIWSMYLLYKGAPVILETTPEQGILLASSLVGWLLVAAVSLLGISMMLWTNGVGPLLGV